MLLTGATLLASCQPALTPAAVRCEAVARELMKNPESMRVVGEMGTGKPDLFLDVRATNAYGAEVKSQVQCKLRDMNGPRVNDVIIDGEEMNPYAVLSADIKASLDAR